jgi:hypothetical protein
MVDTIIYDPQIRVNNETFAIVPGTLKITLGKGESLLKPQSTGNGEITMVYSEDIETKIANSSMSVYSTAEKVDKIIELKDNKFNNYITINSKSLNVVLKDAVLMNDPEITMGNDGQAGLEFSGKPII